MIVTEIKGLLLTFETNEKVFSPSRVDTGTLSMLSQVEFQTTDKVLDLGCGYGVVGITVGKIIGEQNVVLCDVSDDAIQLSKSNALQNGLSGNNIYKSFGLNEITDNDFTLILSNPPYNTDFSVAKHFIEKGFSKLVVGGKMIMVTKRLAWYKNKLTSVFGGVRVIELNGYFVFISEKRLQNIPMKNKVKNKLSKKLQHKLDNNEKQARG